MTDEERAATTARVVFLMAGLTDEGLDRLRTDAEFYAVTHARDLTSDTLAAEQAARHGLLADADAVLSKARRERMHDTSCDCGACVAPIARAHTLPCTTEEYWRRDRVECARCGTVIKDRFGTVAAGPCLGAPDLHDSATDAATVIGTTQNGDAVHAIRPRDAETWSDAAKSAARGRCKAAECGYLLDPDGSCPVATTHPAPGRVEAERLGR